MRGTTTTTTTKLSNSGKEPRNTTSTCLVSIWLGAASFHTSERAGKRDNSLSSPFPSPPLLSAKIPANTGARPELCARNQPFSTFADASISIEWTPATPALEATVKRKPGNARNSQTKKKKLETSYRRRPRRRDQERRRTSSGGGVARQTPHLCGLPTLPPQIPG